MLNLRDATRADVPAIVALLADDRLGARRELDDMALYQAAFDRIAEEHGNRVIVGVDATGSVRATYQITFISGLSLAATRRAQIERVRVVRDLRGQGRDGRCSPMPRRGRAKRAAG